MVVFALVAAACGGGGSAASSVPPTKAQTIAQADRVCSRLNHEVAVAGQQSAGDPASFGATFLRDWGKAIADLRSVPVAPQDAAAFQRFVRSSAAQTPAIRATAAAYATPQASDDHKAIGRQYLMAARANQIAAQYGLHECALDVDVSQPPATSASYMQTLNGICYSAGMALKVIQQQVGKPSTAADFHSYLTAVTPVFDALNRDLGAQPPPTGSTKVVDQYIAINQTGWHDLEAFDQALARGDQSAIAAAQSQVAADTKAGNREARRIGLTSCAD
jgi:hypothetical protein